MLQRMVQFAEAVRSGRWLGHIGWRISIDIGGSDPGPVMAYEVLRHYNQRDLTLRFVSNVDDTDLIEATLNLNAAETLFIICSKTFITQETLTDAHAARAWVVGHLGTHEAVARQRTCSAFGTGSVVANRWSWRSACRRWSPSGRNTFATSWPACTRWMDTFTPRRSNKTSPRQVRHQHQVIKAHS